jgi:hypothetical protein
MPRLYVSLPRGTSTEDEWEGLRDFILFTADEYAALVQRTHKVDDEWLFTLDIGDGAYEKTAEVLREAVKNYAAMRAIYHPPTLRIATTPLE